VNQTWPELEYQISHRHADGSWGRMSERRSHHDSAEHDPEREWRWHRVFKCESCEETVTIVGRDEPGPAPER
jgi:hypothetical protein